MPSAFQKRVRTIQTPSTGSAATGAAAGPTSSSAATPAAVPPPALHPTLRPSPFPQQQPLPLFSTGLQAINDVLTGVGLPSSCLALYLPRGRDHSAYHDADAIVSLEAAAAYADLVTRYGAAQGIAAGQKVLVIGEDAENWVTGLMGWTGQEQLIEKGSKAEVSSHERQETPSEVAEEKLKVAFRYEKLKRIEEQEQRKLQKREEEAEDRIPFCHPFDLSTKVLAKTILEARDTNRLVVHDLDEDNDPDGNSYAKVWSIIERTIESWQEEERSRLVSWQGDGTSTQPLPPSPTPVRIILPSLGSASYTVPRGFDHSTESYRLLLRIKSLVRRLSWQLSSALRSDCSERHIETPAICITSPSSSLLFTAATTSSIDLSSRLSSLSDAALSFSSFSSHPTLRALFGSSHEEKSTSASGSSSSSSSSSSSKNAAFTGSLQILKTPSPGSLKPSSIRASALRGMSSSEGGGGGGGGIGSAGASGGGGSGDMGGSENSLGFKVRRKGIKVEVMGRDLVADWGGGGGGGGGGEGKKESHKKDSSSAAASKTPQIQSKDGQKADGVGSGAAKVSITLGSDKELKPLDTTSNSNSKTSLPATGEDAAVERGGQGNAAAHSTEPGDDKPVPALKGLAALRARGLQAQSQAQASSEDAPSGGGGGGGGGTDGKVEKPEEGTSKAERLRRAVQEGW